MHDNLKLEAREKVVQKLTRDGAVEEHLGQKTTKRVSQRAEDADFQERATDSEVDQLLNPARGGSAYRSSGSRRMIRGQKDTPDAVHTELHQSVLDHERPDRKESGGSVSHKAQVQKAFRREADEAGGLSRAKATEAGGVTEPSLQNMTAEDVILENRMLEITEWVRQVQRLPKEESTGRSVTSDRDLDLSRAVRQDLYDDRSGRTENSESSQSRNRRYAQRFQSEAACGEQQQEAVTAHRDITDIPVTADSKEQIPGNPVKDSARPSRLKEHRSAVTDSAKRAQEKQDVRAVRKKKQKRLYEEQQKQGKTRLRFDPEIPVDAKGNPVRQAGSRAGAAVGRNAAFVAGSAVSNIAHQKFSEKDDGNIVVQAFHETERAGRNTIGQTARLVQSRRSHLSKEILGGTDSVDRDAGASRLKFTHRPEGGTSGSMRTNATRAGQRRIRAADSVSDRFRRRGILRERPGSAPGKKTAQKRRIKRSYAALYRAKRGGKITSAALSGTVPVRTSLAMRLRRIASVFVKKHKAGIVAAIAGILIMVIFASGFGTFSSMVSTVTESVVESTYLGDDADILAVDAAYSQREAQLQGQIDVMESTYAGYDEYRYQIDEITHDPYALTSYLSTKYGTYRLADVQDDLYALFASQYTLNISDETEIRTRIVTRTVIDPVTLEESQIEVEETYEYRILNVVLTNQGLDAVVRTRMDADQLNQYGIYQASLGNRSYLFGDSIVVGNVAGGGVPYEVPPEALSSDRFARMLNEAEKYLGYPYVWGGSSPATSFDCSGFVSWVVNHSGNGWNYGRQTAEGLRNLCAYVSPQDAEPGDLVFFKGTYNTSGASHVGIYVGDGMMIHCGKPIQYSSIETNYWRQHFYCFGRLP